MQYRTGPRHNSARRCWRDSFTVDEMFPTATAVLLRDTYGYDAVHIAEAGSSDPYLGLIGRQRSA